MTDNVYEGLFIFDSNKYARDHDALPKAVEEVISNAGGEVLVSRLWEERRLAYAIKNQRKGAYWLMYFRLGSQHLTGLNRSCELNESVLRHLVLKIHPRLVEPILAHASGAGAVENEAETADEPVAAAAE
ncbi:30S ribosomal protein S6 [Botrimarina hoheduenensis]|uniref:Small ribosomal subunit protein bS6 n=1 Tax=Botrimarina hoheduenensis TaxID=2528000 RepID=A0A5C5WAX9_9BACT|nr:30S ribosomal protein S6 [Botrimarina hoheduenensis]TWT47667.1 30S ribosomal protein S6 [Botrimarina hoheduenensis]